MKTRTELENVLKAELKIWAERQAKEPYEDFYLYYMPTTAEHDGGILICKHRPANPEIQLATGERMNKRASVEQNFNHLRLGVLRTLPVLTD